MILEKRDLLAHGRVTLPLHQLLQDQFRAMIVRMRLPGEHELHWSISVVDDLGQSLRLTQQQIPAFVSGDAARKTYGQHGRIEHRARGFDVLVTFAAPKTAFKDSIANESPQTLLSELMDFPKLLI